MANKLSFVLFALAATFSAGFGGVHSDNPAVTLERIESASRNYAAGLRSENQGVVESTIQRIAKMKLQVPDANTDELREELNHVSVRHQSPVVRFKAYIAACICNDPEWFAQDRILAEADGDRIFIYAIERLEQKVFSTTTFELR